MFLPKGGGGGGGGEGAAQYPILTVFTQHRIVAMCMYPGRGKRGREEEGTEGGGKEEGTEGRGAMILLLPSRGGRSSQNRTVTTQSLLPLSRL